MIPEVSVILPTYNRPEWLKLALNSVLSQPETGEVLICDHGSTPETANVLDDYSDPRIRRWRIEVNRSTPESPYESLGKYATMPYAVFFTDDDIMMPGNLAAKCAVLGSQSDIAAVTSDVEIIDAVGNNMGVNDLGAKDTYIPFGELFISNRIAMPAVVFRSEFLGKFGGPFRVLSDWAFWLEVASVGKIHRIAEPLVKLRLHDQSDSMLCGVKGWEFANLYPRVWQHWIDRGHQPSESDWGEMMLAMGNLCATALQYMRGGAK